MKTRILFPLFLGVILGTAAQAKCQISNDDINVKWTAFKTKKKVGVGGSFTNLDLIARAAQKDLDATLLGQEISIETTSISTKNPARDKKIAKFFFSTMKSGTTITGKVTKVTKDIISIELSFNEKSKVIDFKRSVNKGVLSAKATIDVLDFGMNRELAALNKACFALHEGKTWSDVNIEITANLKNCK